MENNELDLEQKEIDLEAEIKKAIGCPNKDSCIGCKYLEEGINSWHCVLLNSTIYV